MEKFCKYLFTLLPLYFLTFLFSACQEGGEAGDLFGQWRMTGSDTHFVSFSGHIVKIHNTREGEVYGNFQHVGDSLFIQCYSIYGTPADTVLVEQSFGFKPFSDVRLKITKLKSDCLELSKDNQTWSFYLY